MSHAGAIRPLAAAIVVVSLVSCIKGGDNTNIKAPVVQSDAQLTAALLDSVAPSMDSVHINFVCGPVDSIGLTDKNGRPAWSFRRKPNESITWVVPQAVTIDSIVSKSVNPLPLDQNPNDPHGGAPGVAFKATVKSGAANGPYHYVIKTTCNPQTGPAIKLVIDPEMIIKNP